MFEFKHLRKRRAEEKKIFVISHVGNSRDKQEDSFLFRSDECICLYESEKIEAERECFSECFTAKNSFIAFVSDGMGGHSSGEIASSRTVSYLSENYHKIMDDSHVNEASITDEIKLLNQSIGTISKNNAHLKGMGATLCGVVCCEGTLYGVNVGDSRLYSYCGKQLKQLSEDHTEGQRLRKLNLLTEDELQEFSRKKNLYKFVGIESDLIADVFPLEKRLPCDMLLICSDGLTDVVSEEEIADVLGSKENVNVKGNLLIEKAFGRNAGHGDNITLILIEF